MHQTPLWDTTTEQAEALRARVRDERDLWRRVPWVVMLGCCLPPWQSDPSSTVTFSTLDPDRPLDHPIDMTALRYAERGLWAVTPHLAIDCAAGEFCHVTGDISARALQQDRMIGELSRAITGPRTVTIRATDSEVVVAYEALNLIDPRPLLEREGAYLFAAYPDTAMDGIRVQRITPNYTPVGQPLIGSDATLLSLSRGWNGGLGELLQTALLLAAGEPGV